MATERRPLHVTKLEAAAIYEGLTLLSFWKAREGRDTLTPYDGPFVDRLATRAVQEPWPELEATYRGSRAEKRAARRGKTA